MNNDRFKFRVWDKKTNKYDYDVTFLFNTSSVYMDGHKIVNLFRGQTCYAIANSKDIIIEQSTGLKDKNGKLIFEGDIVKCDIDYNDDERVSLIREVKYYEYTASFSLFDKHTFSSNSFGNFHNIEIIGNIHDKE